jgi:hypothetical protein
MKAKKKQKASAGGNPQQLLAKAATAQKLAETAREHLRNIKAEHKLARKAYKEARRAAKQARKAAKSVSKSLKKKPKKSAKRVPTGKKIKSPVKKSNPRRKTVTSSLPPPPTPTSEMPPNQGSLSAA